MRTKLLVFLVGMMLLGAAGARAAQVTLDNLRYSLSDDGSLTAELTICYELTSPALVIPDYVTYQGEEYKVVSIGESVFKDFSNLTSVTLPSGLTSIGNSAFYHCEGLTSIILPEGLTSIGMSAFYHCGGLTSIILPEGLTSIEAFTFEDCSGLTSITLPESLTSIDWKAFRGCRSLSSVTFPSGLTSIGLSAFSDCSSLVSIRCTAYVPPRINVNTFDQSHYAKSLYIPVGSEATYMAATGWGNFRYIIEDADLGAIERLNGLTYHLSVPEDADLVAKVASFDNSSTSVDIPDHIVYGGKEYAIVSVDPSVFRDCSGLTSLILPSGLTSIGRSTFWGCSGLTSLTLPSGLTSIGESAFYRCSGLTSLTLPSGLTSIGESAFCDCSGLTSLTLPSGLTSIGESAFWGCSGLTSLTLPSGLTSIGESAFQYCSSLTSIHCAALVPPVVSYSFSTETYYGTLYIPVGSKSAYMAADYWKNFKTIIEDAGLSIPEHNQSNLINYTDGVITLSDGESPAQVDVYTSDGKQAATSWIVSGGSCDINYLPSGLYIVKVKAGDKMMSRKIVK